AVGSGSFNEDKDPKSMDYEKRPGEAKIYSFPELTEKVTVKDHDGIHCAVFSMDGTKLATASFSADTQEKGRVKLWHVTTGKEIVQVEGITGWKPVIDCNPKKALLAIIHPVKEF